MNKSSQIVVGIAVAIVAAVAGMMLSRSLAPQTAAAPVLESGTWLEPGRRLPELAVVDQAGQPFGRERLEGHWSLIFFGFTSCPDICPTTLAMLGELDESLADLDPASRPRVVFVSVDPERDTPERVAAYVGFFSPAFTGVTGSAEGIEGFAEALHVPYASVPLSDGNYTIDHSSALFLIGPGAELRAIFSAPHSPAALAADLRRIVAHASTARD